MNNIHQKPFNTRLMAFAVSLFLASFAQADEHNQQALEHAKAAADSVGDSQAVGEHATEALQHIDAAKAANPAAAMHYNQSKTDLQNAVKDAARFNSDTAVQDAKDAQGHLDQATHK